MQPHQIRVIDEQKELKIKIDALADFLGKGRPDFIDKMEWNRLDDQLGAMDKYNDILKDRIYWFNTPVEK